MENPCRESKLLRDQLGKRQKELDALYFVGDLMGSARGELDPLLQALADKLPMGWLHDDVCGARIVAGPQSWAGQRFVESTWMQSEPLLVKERPVGQIDISYFEKRPDADEGPFLCAERRLLKSIASMLSQFIAQREANEELRLSNEQLCHVLGATGDAIWDIDLNAGHVRHNTQWCEMLGFSEDLLEHPSDIYYNLIHPDDQERFHSEVRDFLDGGQDFHSEYRIRRADGRYIWIYDHGQVVERNDDGSPKRIIGAFSDISARKQAEEALIQSEQRLLLAQEAAEIGVWDWNPDTGALYVSPECERLYQYGPGQIRSADALRARTHPDDLKHLDGIFTHSASRQASFEDEIRILLPEGQTRWLLLKGRAHVDAEQKTTRLLGVSLDITRRKYAEEQLRLQTDVIRNMQEGVALVDLAGQIIFANPAFDRIFGYIPGETFGLDVSHLNAGTAQEAAQTAAIIMDALQTSGAWVGELKNRKKDGSDFWSRASVASFTHYMFGQIWLCVQSDITEIHNLQIERDEAHHKLECLSSQLQDDMEQLKRELAREVHDEIGAALTGIRMRLDGLRNSENSPAAEPLDALSELVTQAVRRTRQLCTHLRPPILDDLGLVETCRWYIAEWSRTTAIKATGRWNPNIISVSDRLNTDVFRVLQELLTNVARHSGAISVWVTLRLKGRQLTLRVRDNGSGFDTGEPTGFGIPGIRERARWHNGHLSISTSPRGTIVTFEAVIDP